MNFHNINEKNIVSMGGGKRTIDGHASAAVM